MSHIRPPLRSLRAVAAAALLLPAMAGAQGASLPSAESLVAKHVAAIGGEAAVRAHSSIRMTGTFEMAAAGLRGEFTVVGAAPDRNALTIVLPGVGEIRSGYDGIGAWEFNPMVGARLVQGKELARVAEDADFYGSTLRSQKGVASRETVERTTLGGVPCHRVKVIWKSGRESHECYAVEGGLLVALQSTYEGPMGTMETTQLLGGYETFGGVKHATVLRQQMMGAEQVLTVTAVEYDAVSDDAFTPPPAIRTLRDQAKGTPGAR
ncbi:MAG TPA: hypothetical protein VGE02_02710 [Gemmatimonadales bacterium]